MRLKIEHITRHAYAEPLQHAVQHLCLTPPGGAHQTVLQWQVRASGRLFASTDGYGNLTHLCTLPPGARDSLVQAVGVVDTHGVPLLADDVPGAPPLSYLRPTPLVDSDEALRRFARQVAGGRRCDEAALLALAEAVAEQVAYQSGSTAVDTQAVQAFHAGRGVCQDQAHVYIAACRTLGWPARYVSGYFHALGAEDLASHAWAEVCVDLDGRRWLSIDITHRCPIDERHVRLAVGSDYSACAPMRGVRSGGGAERMAVVLRVSELSTSA